MNDPRVVFVENLFEKNKIKPGPLEPYYINDSIYQDLATRKVRAQLSETRVANNIAVAN